MFGASEKPEVVAQAVRAAEQAAKEAAEALAQVEAASRDRLAEGSGNSREEALKVMEVKLCADAERTRVVKLKSKLRDSIRAEDEKARRNAQKIVEECDSEDRTLAEKMEPHASALVRIVAQRYGTMHGAAAAITLWDVARGRFPTTIGLRYHEFQSTAKTGDDSLAQSLFNACETVETSATNQARREAARTVLAKVVDVEAQVAQLLQKD
jgi:hypothetical protein